VVEVRDERVSRPTRHLDQIDLVRLLAFTAVIAVHSLDFTQTNASQLAAGTLMLLQFGRAVFFALTGFVLVHATWERPLDTPSFWRRRFPYVLVPYLAWSVIYYVFGILTSSWPPFSWSAFYGHVEYGDAGYHLYFLLVTLQLYLVFPLVLRFVRATRHRAWLVLGIVGLADLVWQAMLQYGQAPANWVGWFWIHGYELLPTYAIYVLVGCYAALHLDRVNDVVRRRGGWLVAAGAAGLVVGEAVYAVQLGGQAPRVAGGPLQPAMIVVSLGVLVLLYVACTRWADRGAPRRGLVAWGSDLSFGIYLAHPFVLTILLMNGLASDDRHVPALVAAVIAFVLTAVGATVASILARRTSLSLALTGRRRRRPAEQPSSVTAQAMSRPLAPSTGTIAP
jgi:peptidoglycan/LPS O-acetylase OafA/YrhL